MDEFSRWISQGMRGFRDLTAMFREIYGLSTDSALNRENWQAACDSFDKAYRAYLEALDVVPRTEYMALKGQLEESQRKVEELESVLRRLRLELSEARMAPGDAARGFQELIRIQTDQFQELTESFSRLFSIRRPDQEDLEKP